ncbi:MAG: 50S ribosomal protein L22 [Candidatus Sungbacteria bacterium RIFCSPHIGHO2_02_FULL_52_23]|uniref:Large ribosomal subunit protein uL22 n=1 Tax=Candidatus Sungbacteria bacterium RIFCSPHIGHO2_02_FULL_52_23 TaxID=1802274 RepID=A0A1G2KWI9_9BACT|nr:MAG: 50S ribosomal protein L22 [Candidatus Sungbacteria bacterium RIFCSPHIGHO2_02_FULL_52_23]
MEIKAQLRHLHIAPRKVRAVAGLIRGMGATDAERELAHLIKRSSDPLRKLLRSALANATHNFHLDEAGIRVKEIRIDPGPVSRRFRPRAFGRAAPIRRRTSHVILILEAKGIAPRPRTRMGVRPIVREATHEDMRRDADDTHGDKSGDREAETSPRKAKPVSLARRVFQRKVI